MKMHNHANTYNNLIKIFVDYMRSIAKVDLVSSKFWLNIISPFIVLEPAGSLSIPI